MAHHHHHHHDSQHRQHGHGFVQRNQEYFDQEAHTYDTRHVEVLQLLNKEIRDNKDFIGADWSAAAIAAKPAAGDVGGAVAQATVANNSVGAAPVRLLDYACGTGAMSRILSDLVDECVGIDISPQMVEVYNKRAQDEGYTKRQRFAIEGNLAAPSDPNPMMFADPKIFNDFAIAVVGGGFHHFEHPELAAERLVQRLRPGGVLVIWDFFTHDHYDTSGHGAAHTIVKHGFSEGELKEMFTNAGAGEGFKVLDLGEYTMDNRGKKMTRRIFLARGQKAKSGL